MRRADLIAILCCAGLAIPNWPGEAGQTAFTFGPTHGWRYLSFPGRQGAQFKANGADAVTILAEAAVGVLWHKVPAELSAARHARWRWSVTAGIGPTDLTKKGGDDRALAVYFIFADGDEGVEEMELMDLLRHGQGHLLMYVWGSAAPPGTVLPSPYFDGHGRTIVKRAADAPKEVWFSEAADLRRDFRNAFGRLPGRLVAVAVSSDSDDTNGLNIAAIADLSVD